MVDQLFSKPKESFNRKSSFSIKYIYIYIYTSKYNNHVFLGVFNAEVEDTDINFL